MRLAEGQCCFFSIELPTNRILASCHDALIPFVHVFFF